MSESEAAPAKKQNTGGPRLSASDLMKLSRSDAGDAGLVGQALIVAAVLVVFLALSAPPMLAIVLWALLLVGLAVPNLPGRDLTSDSTLNRSPWARLLAVVTLAILAARGPTGLDVLGWITLIGLALVIVAEPVLQRFRLYTLNAAANLPGMPPHRSDRLPIAVVNLATLIALALGGISVVTGFTWIPALLIAFATGLICLADLLGRINRIRRATQSSKRLRRAVKAYGPTFALYWRADPGTDYQISMWLPYLERLGKPYLVIVRSRANFDEALALTDKPVLLRRTLPDLDDLVVPSLKTVFYVNNAASNSQMVRYPGLKHIMLNHGDSDKSPSYNPVSRMYDQNFVAGQAAIDRFANHGVEVPPSQFTIVGRPQIEDVHQARALIGDIPRPRVLYAPTWAGFTADAQYSSLPVAPAIIEALVARGCDVVFRPHPYSYRSPKLASACTQIVSILGADSDPAAHHVYGEQAEREWTLADCFNASDALISDVSSVVADYLQSEKPLAICAVHTNEAAFVDEFPLAEAAYVLDASTGQVVDLDARLDQLLLTDPARAERRALKVHYLGDPGDREYANLFFDAVASYV